MKLIASLLALLAGVAFAEKDDAYYVNGVQNPAVDDQMYWHEGRNVIEDLDQFQTLYVTYHHCAWETPTGDDEDGGGGGGDGDDWYVGSVPSFRANVAFSLYGEIKGDKNSGCGRKTFINSFHTTRGLESFTNAMAAAGLTDRFQYYGGEDNDDSTIVTSTCNQDEDQDSGEDDYYYNGVKMSSGMSYGLGCSSDGKYKFAIQSYLGAYCDANAINSTLDDLADLNERLQATTCVPIYKSGDYYAADSHDEDNSSPLSLLATSRSCHIHDGTGSCPDPYKRLKGYEREMLKATGAIANVKFVTDFEIMVLSYAMICLAGILVMVAIGLVSMDACSDSGGSSRRKNKSVEDSSESKEYKSNYDLPPKEYPLTRDQSVGDDSIVSRLSYAMGMESLAAYTRAYAKKSRKGSKHNRTKDSRHSRRSTSPSKSSRSLRVENKSNRSLKVEKHDQKTKETKVAKFVYNDLKREASEVGGPEEILDDQSVEMKVSEDPSPKKSSSRVPTEIDTPVSMNAINQFVHSFKNKAVEVFRDEDDTVEGEGEEPLPYMPPQKAVDEKEWSTDQETASKKKYRKQQWFRKLVKGSSQKQINNRFF